MIATGVFLFTYADTQVDLFGVSVVLFASLAGGLRWVLVQVSEQKPTFGLAWLHGRSHS